MFEVMGDPVALEIVRRLLLRSLTQAELVRITGASQSSVSRAANNLRILGMTTVASQRGKISLVTPGSVRRLLDQANGLAIDLLAAEAEEQARLTADSVRWDAAVPRSDDGGTT